MLSVFDAIQKLAKRFQKTRNRICHWTWGFSPQISDGFLLLDPKAQAPDGDIRRNLIYVYREADFDEAISGNERVAGYMMTLRFIVMGHVANRDGRLETELKNQPEIKDLISKP